LSHQSPIDLSKSHLPLSKTHLSDVTPLDDPLLSRRTAILRLAASAAALSFPRLAAKQPPSLRSEISRLASAPVLRTEFLTEPVIIESIELLRNHGVYLLRTRSRDGVEVITVPHEAKMQLAAPLLFKSVLPVLIGKDARQLEALLWQVYRHESNYKMQGLLFWLSVAAVEMALLELLAQTARRPLADLFGGTVRKDIPVYFASGNRGNKPEEEIEHLQALVADSGVRALKFRLGGRMSRNVDSLPGRSETLIPLVRETFGKDFTLYADANSSYDATEAIRIGRIMESYRYGFLEEPCEFDDLWNTKKVADTLSIPIAGGEQEFSLHRWQWMIAERGVDIVQPDLHYGGGFIRATQVARMAAAAGILVTPHMSGGGLGYLELVHFASFTPNIGPYMEFKGNLAIPIASPSSSLRCENGIVHCPTGPGFGITIDPAFIHKSEIIRA
jgi:L-alanine-DL-glutamate epimerase-like enolase superfamily enzyme